VEKLIFQLHLPHVIPNSMQALHALSHTEITFRKALSQYQHVSLTLLEEHRIAFPKDVLSSVLFE